MDSLFSKGFKSSKCKTLIKLTVARIKLLRNKRDIQVKQLRREIANLLQAGQEPSARIRVEHIIREQNIMASYEILDLFCELVVVRLPIIESQKQCPLDLKEAISSLVFAAPRCADLPELLEVRGLFGVKYGKEFMAAAAELRPGCGVNRRIIEKLSVRAPSGEVKLKLLKEIAAEHNVEWDPSNAEAEFLNPPEDLLNGPSQFLASSQVTMSALSRKEIHPEEVQTSVKTEEDFMEVNVPTQSVTKLTPLKPSSADHEDEKEQFVPFAVNLPGKFPHASKTDSPPVSSSVESRTDDPYSVVRSTSKMDYTATPSTQVPATNQGHVAASSTGVAFRSDESQKYEYASIAFAAQAAAESAELAAVAARAAASLAKGENSNSKFVAKTVKPTDNSSSDGEDDAYLENPYSFQNQKSGGYEDNAKRLMQKDDFAVPEKPVFDDDDDDEYGGTDVLEARILGKSSAEKQEFFGGLSSSNRSGLFNEVSREQSDSFNPSQPGLAAQYDEDMFDLHSEKERVQKEPRTDEPKLNLDFFSGKHKVYSSDDTDYGPSELESEKGNPRLLNSHKTKPPSKFEHLGVEEEKIVDQSFPYTSSNIPFQSKYSDPSTIIRSQANRPSYESPSSSPPSPHFVDSHSDAKTFLSVSGGSQGSAPSAVSQPPRRPPPEVPRPSPQNSFSRVESGGIPSRSSATESLSAPPVHPKLPSPSPQNSFSRVESGGIPSSRSSSGTEFLSAPPVHPKLPDYDDLAARFLAMRSSRS